VFLREYDKISVRLVEILSKFNNGEELTVEGLVDEFNVSRRTIQRDLNERLHFLPIRKQDGRYSLEHYALGKLSFRDIRNFAAISGIDALYPSLDRGFITDILNEKINRVYLVKHPAYEDLGSRSEWFDCLSVAILKHQQVTFVYHRSDRVVRPYKLVNNNAIWYLVAQESQQLKHYALSKITKLQSTDEVFDPSTEILTLIEENEMQWFSQDTFEVRIQIDHAVQSYFLRRDLFPNQQIIEQTDEYLLLSTHVSYETEILAIVKQWLPHIRILSPIHLQEKLQDILTQYLQTTQPVMR
jgi:predicted DNA-binding transcriptional regulator YafY